MNEVYATFVAIVRVEFSFILMMFSKNLANLLRCTGEINEWSYGDVWFVNFW